VLTIHRSNSALTTLTDRPILTTGACPGATRYTPSIEVREVRQGIGTLDMTLAFRAGSSLVDDASSVSPALRSGGMLASSQRASPRSVIPTDPVDDRRGCGWTARRQWRRACRNRGRSHRQPGTRA